MRAQARKTAELTALHARRREALRSPLRGEEDREPDSGEGARASLWERVDAAAELVIREGAREGTRREGVVKEVERAREHDRNATEGDACTQRGPGVSACEATGGLGLCGRPAERLRARGRQKGARLRHDARPLISPMLSKLSGSTMATDGTPSSTARPEVVSLSHAHPASSAERAAVSPMALRLPHNEPNSSKTSATRAKSSPLPPSVHSTTSS